MAKTKITKPTGNMDYLTVVSAFKVENNTYVVLDSEKMGSMGLPIIYVCKYTTKLEKINDVNEWQSVKNYLKGIISGTNFEYVKLEEAMMADEVYYTPLTLPQSSFDAIKNRYVVKEAVNQNEQTTITPASPEISPVMPNVNTVSNTAVNISTTTSPSQQESVADLIEDTYRLKDTPVAQPSNVTPNLEPVINNSVIEPKINPSEMINTVTQSSNKMNFDQDKETFLKACENMFDALISKYQKELNLLEQKEQELIRKEAEINAKMESASEHLKNAEAKEQVANIAHDNAKKVMDLNDFMPVNPNNVN